MAMNFISIYKDTSVIVKCEVENSVNFNSSLYTNIFLLKKDSANEITDLNSFAVPNTAIEADYLQAAL
jgi:hypothetical protein